MLPEKAITFESQFKEENGIEINLFMKITKKKSLIFNFIELFVVFLSIILWKILMKIAFQFSHSLLSRGRIMTAINLIFYEKILSTRFAHYIAYDLTMIMESVVFIRSLEKKIPIKKKKLFLFFRKVL